MDKQPNNDNPPLASQTKLWSDAELRRVSRVFELLIRIDKRVKKGKGNAQQTESQ